MTITTEQLDELERRTIVHRDHGNSATISVPLDVALQLVAIARAALSMRTAWVATAEPTGIAFRSAMARMIAALGSTR